MENLITKAELTAYAPDLDLSAYSDATISGMITRATKRMIEYCDVAGFFKMAVTSEREKARINPQGELVYSFKRRTVADGDVSAIRLVSVDVSQTLTLQSSSDSSYYYFIQDGNYLIYPSNFLIAHGTGLMSLENSNLFIEVDYTGGYATDIADLPVDLKEACTLMVRSQIARKFNTAGANSFSQGSVSMSFGGGRDVLDKNVSEALSILDSGGYVRTVI